MKTKRTVLVLAAFVLLSVVALIWYMRWKGSPLPLQGLGSVQEQEESLPYITAEMGGRQMNLLRPYKNAVSNNVMVDTLTILPEDRQLRLQIRNNAKTISGMHYEIRNAGEELIESTALSGVEGKSGDFDVILPIQNLILPDKEYKLRIRIDYELVKEEESSTAKESTGTEESTQAGVQTESLYYYSRIRAYENSLFETMLNLANDFSLRNFDYEQARENTTYLETDGSILYPTLADVNLKSSFDVLTYHKLKLKPLENREIRLLNYDGRVGAVQIKSLARREPDIGRVEYYEIDESFVFREGEERLYMLDYRRKMREVFAAGEYNFTGTRLSLGIVNPENISSRISADGRYVGFVSARDLFLFDNQDNVLHRVYSGRPATEEVSAVYDHYDVKILRMDSKQLHFMVYGYFGKGEHAGRLGTAVYAYDIGAKQARELVFVEDFSSFGELREDVLSLSYMNGENVLYFKKADMIYSLDIDSGNTKVEVSRLEEREFAASADGESMAYTEGENILYFRDLSSGESKKLELAAEERIHIAGFINADVVVGISNVADDYTIHQKPHHAHPREIRILDKHFQVLKNYISPNHLISNISVEGDIIKFDILEKEDRGGYRVLSSDSIVSSSDKLQEDGIGYYASESKTRVYYIQTPAAYKAGQTRVGSLKPVKTDTGRSYVLAENTKSPRYAVVADGEFVKSYADLQEAIKSSYGAMGFVFYDGQIVYARAQTPVQASNEISPEAAAVYIKAEESGALTDLYGIELRQALYYVGRGENVLTYNSSGEALLIYGYDRYNISVYDLQSGQTYKIGQGDASADFALSYNDFSSFFTFY